MKTRWILLLTLAASAADWRQFRGPDGRGVEEGAIIPVSWNPDWHLELPAGKSSPVLHGTRIFLTGHDGDALLTIAVDRDSGKQLWRHAVTRTRQEQRHKLNDPAAPTAVVDGNGVYVFFPDFGLLGYSHEGKELWRLPLAPMPSMQGVAASPLLAGSRLILVVDQTQGSYAISVNTRNGEILWRQQRAAAAGGTYASPALLQPKSGPAQFVTFSPLELAGFSVETGEKLWWVGGLPPQPKSTPLIHDGVIYAYSRSFYGDSLPAIAPWSKTIAENDRNQDGRLQKDEAPDGPAKQYFGVVDRNKDGAIEEEEWQGMAEFAAPPSVLVAVRPSGRGDLSGKAVLWRFHRNIPDVPMPLLYRGVLYLVQNGGILTALDPKTGEVLKQGRLTGALGDYYSSPVAAGGRILFANQEGKLTVVRADPDWEVLTVHDLGEDCFATPAIADQALYIRTGKALYRFPGR